MRGLTLPQIKVAIIKQIRKYIDDEVLGLVAIEENDPEAGDGDAEIASGCESRLSLTRSDPLDDLEKGRRRSLDGEAPSRT